MQHQSWNNYAGHGTPESTPHSAQASNEPSNPVVSEPGHALATLRALAQAQEEQAKLIKEQERANQAASASSENSQKEEEAEDKLATTPNAVTLVPSTAHHAFVKPSATSPSSDDFNSREEVIKRPVSQQASNSLQLAVGDQKSPTAKPSKSVLQLKGQLVRTLDQKLMLVTEVGGKKVGYLISPQSGQLQSAVASQLIPKLESGGSQVQISMQNSPVTNTASTKPEVSTGTSNTFNSNASKVIENTTKPLVELSRIETKIPDGKSVLSVIAENNKLKKPNSSEEDGGSLANVAATLQNTHLEQPIQVHGVKKVRRRGKGKKKKDSNEPLK